MKPPVHLSDSRDNIYQTEQKVAPFKFDEKVAAVFPDMIQRSVPGYETIIEGIQHLAQQVVQDNSNCFDLGCSWGAASLAMSHGIQANHCRIIAIDNSPAMVERCRLFVEAYHHQTPIEVVCGDLQDQAIEQASMVVLNFTLQFIPLEQRDAIIQSIYNGLNPGGVLVLSEKIQFPNDELNRLMIDLHHQFKRNNGYSELEISQKRNALENVLVPETIETHKSRLAKAGFKQLDVWYQQFNFCSLIAVK
jgi:tRNA (cmo5U34)-methyltransferase